MSAEQDLKKLNYKRGAVKGKLTAFQKFVTNAAAQPLLSELQLAELQLRFDKIVPIFDEFDALQTDIEMLSAAASAEDITEERVLFEDAYYASMSSAQVLIQKYARRNSAANESEVSSASTVVKAHNANFINLPKINLPRFEGGYQDWLAFRDTYLSLIHNNDSINTINKFHYLRASLKGSAALIIQSLELTCDNYAIAWQLLSERYDNQKLLVANHVNALFNVEAIHKESSQALRNILDVTTKNLRALHSLGQPTDNWDTLVVHMMSCKLDAVTTREWEERRNKESTIPTLEFFKTFLLQRADFLESLEEIKIQKHKNDSSSSSSSQVQSKSKYFVANASFDANRRPHYSNLCPLCRNKHHLYNCYSFRKLPVETRLNKAKQFKVCLNCLCHGHSESQCRLSHCKYCNKKHHTLIHSEPMQGTEPQDIPNNIAVVAGHSLTVGTTPKRKLLSTAIVKVVDSKGGLQTVRILLDNGSTLNFITDELCNKLGLRTYPSSTSVTGIMNHTSRTSQECSIQIYSVDGKFKMDVDCSVAPVITPNIPSTYMHTDDIQFPLGIQLADPTFDTPSSVDILLGVDIFWDVLGTNKIELGANRPSLRETKLGWLVCGVIHQPKSNVPQTCMFTHEVPSDSNIDISRFWELDTIAPRHKLTSEENECEEHFFKTTTREADGRFKVSIPLKESPEVLGDSYQRALATFLSVERRLERNPTLKSLYVDFLSEYESLGHMSKSVGDEHSVSCLLPHHGVLRDSTTTKLRVVFNGSSPTTSGKSFNDIQRVGPTIQDDLQSILIRFRQHNFVVTADVEKMYRQILIEDSQRSLQKILWRSDPSQPISIYTLNTVTYGTASAPYLATRSLTQLGYDSKDKDVRHAICHDFYVDDFLSGRDTVEETIALCRNVTHELESAKLHLRKWHSNNKEILLAVCQDVNGSDTVDLSIEDSSKTLGLNWACFQDTLTFSINVDTQNKINKRSILSTISQVFDPLGLVSPCIVEAKIIMQQLWISKCSWDGEIPSSIKDAWVHFARTLPYLNSLSIPRCIKLPNPAEVSLHVFTDASEKAYGACIYVRSVGNDGAVSVRLLASKSKVAPIKPQATIPRLELSGALLGAKLYTKVSSSLTLEMKECVFWCDSSITLGWIAASPRNLKTFVRHRVSEIQERTAGCRWRYVPSKENPADLVSRGLSADQLGQTSLWWSGPEFIQLDQKVWPNNPNKGAVVSLPEMVERSLVIHEQPENIFTKLIQNSSGFTKLKRIMAYVLRFVHNSRNKESKQIGNISHKELDCASYFLLRRAQEDSFPREVEKSM